MPVSVSEVDKVSKPKSKEELQPEFVSTDTDKLNLGHGQGETTGKSTPPGGVGGPDVALIF